MKTILGTITDELEFGDDELIDSEVARRTPTPGGYYQINRGDILLRITESAYPGEKRFTGAKRINNHPRNRKYFRSAEKENLFPRGKVSFLPRYSCDIGTQIRTKTGVPGGRCYAVLYIPENKPGPLMNITPVACLDAVCSTRLLSKERLNIRKRSGPRQTTRN